MPISRGDVYLSEPIRKGHVEFNAHRIFYASAIAEVFPGYKLVEYSCTYDGYIEYNVEIRKYDNDVSLGGNKFGLFHFKKFEVV